MLKLAQVWRTTTVRLTAIFVVTFVLFAVLLLAAITYQSSIQIQQQQAQDIDREVAYLRRTEELRGFRGVVIAVDRLARQPGPGIYYVGDNAGLMIAGNVQGFPVDVLQAEGTYSFPYDRESSAGALGDEVDPPPGMAIVRSVLLQSGLRLVVGRDVVERRGFTAIIFETFFYGVIGIVVFSVITGAVTARRVLRRIDTINATASKIVSGNLSERVPVTTRNDEFDTLAVGLNSMLDRNEQLLQGLKEVTDNVAHDLKTPLTRMRNKAEAALRHGTADVQRDALETTLAESEKLIRTFNALLMIARAEAGAPSGAFGPVDVSAVAADLAELYEPVADERGVVLGTAIAEGVMLTGNRELLGQALVNLIENSLKYGVPAEGGRIVIGVANLDRRVAISVADNGPGIPEQDRQRVLERWVRLDNAGSEAGSGLGLSLAAAVARLHKGTLRLEDNAPGVRAVIDLPAA